MTDAKPALLLTRPEADAEAFVEALRAQVTPGPVVISPLMRIVARGVRPDLAGVDGVIFTSSNGVRAFHGDADRRAFCVGRKTTQVAQERGFRAEYCGADADALVDHLRATRPVTRLLHLRGQHARGEIAARLTQSGLATDEAVIYDQQELPLSDAGRALLNGAQPVVLPLFSPRSADILGGQITPRAPLLVVAISPAVAERAAALRPTVLHIAENPDLTGICTAVAALYLQPSPLERG